MYGEASPCLFLVFSNAGPGGDEALAEWYMEVHGPDSFKHGSFYALHRYQAVGEYDARFLALWEGVFTSREDARSKITPSASGLKKAGRITDDLIVVWSMMNFLSDGPLDRAQGDVSTLTLVEGGAFGQPATTVYHYGDLTLYESSDGPDVVREQWAGRAKEGMAPHGLYKNVFDHPDSWPPVSPPLPEPWVSHWRPIGSLRKEDI